MNSYNYNSLQLFNNNNFQNFNNHRDTNSLQQEMSSRTATYDVENDDQKEGMKRLLEKNTLADDPDTVNHLNNTPAEVQHAILESGCFSNLSTMSRVNKYWLSLITQKISQIFRNYEGFKNLIEECKNRSYPFDDISLYSQYRCEDINLVIEVFRDKLCKKKIDFKTVLKINDLLKKIEFIKFCSNLLNPFYDWLTPDEHTDSAIFELRSKIDSNDKIIVEPDTPFNYLALTKDMNLKMDDFERLDAIFNYLTDLINLNLKLLEKYQSLEGYTRAKPPKITLLKNLTDLRIHGTFDELFELPKLKKLILNDAHRFSNKICELTNLKSLNLNGCRKNATIEIPKEIVNLINLTELMLFDCNIKSFPEAILNLTNLKVLDLELNHLRTLPEKLWSLITLEKLNLNSNPLISISCDISKLTNLQELSFFSKDLVFLPPTRVWESLPNLVLSKDMPVSVSSNVFFEEQNRRDQLIEQAEEYLEEEDMLVDFENKLRELKNLVIKNGLESLIEELPSDDDF